MLFTDHLQPLSLFNVGPKFSISLNLHKCFCKKATLDFPVFIWFLRMFEWHNRRLAMFYISVYDCNFIYHPHSQIHNTKQTSEYLALWSINLLWKIILLITCLYIICNIYSFLDYLISLFKNKQNKKANINTNKTEKYLDSRAGKIIHRYPGRFTSLHNYKLDFVIFWEGFVCLILLHTYSNTNKCYFTLEIFTFCSNVKS